MQTGFLIKILPWESRVVFKKLGIPVRVFVGRVGTEGVSIFPAPDWRVVLVDYHPRGIEMIGVNEVHLDRAGGCGFLDHGHRNIL